MLTTGQDLCAQAPPISSDASSSSDTCCPLHHRFILHACLFLFSHLQQQKRRCKAKIKHLHNEMETRRSWKERADPFFPSFPAASILLGGGSGPAGLGSAWPRLEGDPAEPRPRFRRVLFQPCFPDNVTESLN